MVMLMFLVFFDIFFWFSPLICHSKFLRNLLLELCFMVFGCLLLLFFTDLLFEEINSFILPSTDFSFLMLSTFRRLSNGIRIKVWNSNYQTRLFATPVQLHRAQKQNKVSIEMAYDPNNLNPKPYEPVAANHFTLKSDIDFETVGLTHSLGKSGDHKNLGNDIASPGDCFGNRFNEKRNFVQYFYRRGDKNNIQKSLTRPLEVHEQFKINRIQLRYCLRMFRLKKTHPKLYAEGQIILKDLVKQKIDRKEKYELLVYFFEDIFETAKITKE